MDAATRNYLVVTGGYRAFTRVGGFIALWVTGYGIVLAAAVLSFKLPAVGPRAESGRQAAHV